MNELKILFLSIIISLPIIAKASSMNIHSFNQDVNTIAGMYEYKLNENFAALDTQINKWNNPEERDQDGLWKLLSTTHWGGCYGSHWQESLQFYQKWLKFNPESAGAATAESRCWIDAAWAIRGGKYNPSDDPVAMNIFTPRIEKAEQILKDSKKFSASNPLWYLLYLDLAISTKRDDKFIESIFNEGITKFPSFQELYFLMTKHWAARSGEKANWQKVNEVINQAVTLTSNSDGISNYARLYSWIAYRQSLELNIFQDGLISWPKMRESYEDLVRRYPSPNNLNDFAVYACRAGDK